MNVQSPNMPVTFEPNAETSRQLRDAFGRFATGVTVVTAQSANGPIGITVNSFASVSLDPALVLWSPAKETRRYQPFVDASHYAIHVLADNQADICGAFAKDAFALNSIEHILNDENVPLIPGCLARFECKQVNIFDGGDHSIILGEVQRAEMREGDALAFFAGKFGKFAQG